MEPVIRLDALSKRYGSDVALNEVSLEVPPGVVFGLLGENGAGKTTAIRIMLGLAEANSGQAQVLGMPSGRQGRAIRRRVGYVAERPTLYDWMTVKEIGWFAAGFYSDGYLSNYQRLVRDFGLQPTRKIRALSKGMRAKVCLSLALAHDPELLVLDEPTSGLDVLVRREFLESMVDRAASGKTVFLSSHQIDEVERVSDVVAILRQGQLVLVEPLDQLKDRIRQVIVTLRDGVPLVWPGFLPRQYARPATAEERVTVRMYERAWALYDVKRNMPPEEESSTAQNDSNADRAGSEPPPELRDPDLEWVEKHRAALELALKASRRADADFFASNLFRSSAAGHAAVMGHKLRVAGEILRQAGQLDKALEYCLGALRVSRHLRERNRMQEHIDRLERKVHYAMRRWAAHPEQTAASVSESLKRIDAINDGIPPRDTAIKNRYLFARRAVNADQDALAYLIDVKLLSEREAFQTDLWSRCLPWERARAIRVLNRITAEQLRRWREAAERVENNRRCHYPDQQPWRPHMAWNDDVESLTFPMRGVYQPFADAQIRGLMEMETQRRATRLILALLAWKLEHGELPRTLEALEGDVLESLPVDPFTGEAFRYFPEGLPVDIRWSRERRSYDTVPANRPFVWSAGSKLHYRPRETRLLQKFHIERRRFPHTYLTHPTSEIELWQSGWFFPVPQNG